MINKGKIIFVNGYWMPGIIGRLLLKSAYPGKRYWLQNFEKEAEAFLGLSEAANTHIYIDASSVMGIDMNGNDRYRKAFSDYDYVDEFTNNGNTANENNSLKHKKFNELITGMDKAKHCFYIITHSEGSAYGAGLAEVLISKGWRVELVLHLSADEANEFDTPEKPLTYQLGFTARKNSSSLALGDWVTKNHAIRKGVDKWGLAYQNVFGLRIHNKSRCGDVFRYVKDLQGVEVRSITDKNGKRLFEQIPQTTPNGTIFTIINGMQLKS